MDPYVIQDLKEAPEEVPDVRWSDMLLYMVSTSTPSPYTREEIKVARRKIRTRKINVWYTINTT